MPGILSQRDHMILESMFDTKADARQQHTQSQPASSPSIPADTFARLREREHSILNALNVADPSPDTIKDAICSLSQMINGHSTYSSAYVNRAQVRRLLVPTNLLYTKERAEETGLVMADLDMAIQIASPTSKSQRAFLYEQSVLATAHTHRAFLMMRAADLVRSGVALNGVSDDLGSKGAEAIDEMVFRDFELGGASGNEEAAKMAVRTNPYAKLCGAVVSEAMKKEMEEYRRLL